MKNILIIVLSIFIAACTGNSKKPVPTQNEIVRYKNALVGIHKEIVKNQADSIQRYADSMGWQISSTPTGLWISFVTDAPGPTAKAGDEVYLAYKTSLLNGKLCYDSDSLGYQKILCGRGGIESGLEEALLLMSKGDKSRVILPSHLAFGVAGDFKCVPRLSILIYELEVLEIFPH